MKFIFYVFLLTSSLTASAKLLDKIVLVIDDKVATQSLVNRVLETWQARNSISPQLYQDKPKTKEFVVDQLINAHIIKTKLKELGYIVSDEQVEEQIKQTESRLGLNRRALLKFLTGNGISFDEYFELIRMSYEYNIYLSRIVTPLITITDQEIKNEYLRMHDSPSTVGFQYDLEDFSIHRDKISESDVKKLKNYATKYKANGVLPSFLKELETNVIEEVEEGSLLKDLKMQLRAKKEGEFTTAVLIGDYYHVFYIAKKQVVESQDYSNLKPRIRNILYTKEIDKINELWLLRQRTQHYIKTYF